MKQNLFKLLSKAIFSATSIYNDSNNSQYYVSKFKLITELDIISKHINLQDKKNLIIEAAQNIGKHKDFSWEPVKWNIANNDPYKNVQLVLLIPLLGFIENHSQTISPIIKNKISFITNSLMGLNKFFYESTNFDTIYDEVYNDLQHCCDEKNDQIQQHLQVSITGLKISLDIANQFNQANIQFSIPVFLHSVEAVNRYQMDLKKGYNISIESFNKKENEDFMEFLGHKNNIINYLETQYSYLQNISEEHKVDLISGKYDLYYQPELSGWEKFKNFFIRPPQGIGDQLSEIVNSIEIRDDIDFQAIEAELWG